MCKNVCIQ
jgi:alpha-tubulin suppressor-like RCC1 family protein